MSLWEQAHAESKAQITKEILDVMSGGVPQGVKLRLSEYKSIDVDASGLLDLLNFEPEETAHLLAALITTDDVMRESGKRVFRRRIEELADQHAELDANDAERQARSESSRVVAFG